MIYSRMHQPLSDMKSPFRFFKEAWLLSLNLSAQSSMLGLRHFESAELSLSLKDELQGLNVFTMFE